MKDNCKSAIAAMIIYTRLHVSSGKNLESSHFDRAISFWPLTGFVTGGLCAFVYWIATFIFPPLISIVLALSLRLFVTGFMHEDGLADFCDGFGIRRDRQRTLDIMKDSSIGTFGVIGLIIYFLGMIFSVTSFPVVTGAILLLCSDVWCKWCTSMIVFTLPYVRNREESKSLTIYRKPSYITLIITGFISLLPFFFLEWPLWLCLLSAPIIVAYMIRLLQRRIGGYTGDCCGACFLISQLLMILVAVAIYEKSMPL